MPTVIDSLVISLGFDTKDLNKGRKEVDEGFKKTREGAKKTADEVEAAGKRGAAFFSNLRGELLALFAVFTAGKGIKDFIADQVATAAAVSRTGKVIHMTTEELSAWRNVAKMTGGTAEGITGTLQGLVDEFQNFQMTGESSVIPYMRALGVSFADGRGHMKDMGQFLLEVADRVKGMDPARARAFMQGLKIDPDTINLLLQGRQAVQAMLDEQKRSGNITKEDAEAAKEYQRRWAEVTQASETAGRTMLTMLAPALIAVLKAVTAVAQFLIRHKAILVAVFAVLTAAVLALSAAMIGSFASTAVGAMAVGFRLLTGLAGGLAMRLGLLIVDVLPALGEAFFALGVAIEATPIGWILTGIAAVAAGIYLIATHLGAVKRLWHDVFGGGEDHFVPGGGTFGGRSAPPPPRQTGWAPQRDNSTPGQSGWPAMNHAPNDIKALMAMGWTREQAAGIAANIARESGRKGDRAVGDGGAAYGIAQWHSDRQAAFARWAGHDIHSSTRAEQLAFINYELRHGNEQRAGRALSKATNASQAGAIISSLYERPASAGEASIRGAMAAAILAKAGSGAKISGVGARSVASSQVNNRTSHNQTKNDTRIGQITINSKASDARGIASDISSELALHSFASQANAGAS